MIIESVRICNFHSILDETLHCENLTALVGANGSGKSSFLRGLDLFYDPSPRVEPEDFYNNDTNSEIVIAVTFRDLSPEARGQFGSYLQNDRLTVERVFALDASRVVWKYHGATLRNPAFQPIRDALSIKDRGKTAKPVYEDIRKQPDYDSLPEWSTIGAVEEALKPWEAVHSEKCTRQRDDGQFFGFKEVAQGYLGRFTRYLFIPAVRDARDDSSEGSGSVLTELMDLVVRNSLANNEALKKLSHDTQAQYDQIMDPANLTELNTLAERMTATLTTFAPGAGVKLRWLPLSEVDIPLPQADVKLMEDGYMSAATRTGHGLQRAFILTILQHLAVAQTTAPVPPANVEGQAEPLPAQEIKLPNLVLAIEEPELYQHPNRQRHLAKILLQLATGKTPGVAERTQIIYATHSPLFVGIDRINQIRLLRKATHKPDKPKVTKIVSTDLNRVAEIIWKADGEPAMKYSGETLLPRLHTIMTPWMSEGFFADVIVLVEGEDDRAAILGVALSNGLELESMGIAIVPCGGKTSLDRPTAIFSQLGIPVYLIWDSDRDDKNNPKPEDNHRLLRLVGHPVEDWPSTIQDRFACFENNLETMLQAEIGKTEFDTWLQDCQNELGIPKRKHAIKNPVIISTIIHRAKEAGLHCRSLEQILEKVIGLKDQKAKGFGTA